MLIRGMESAGSFYAHESSLDTTLKKAQGIFYTPLSLAEFIVEKTIGAALKDASVEQARRLRVLDPTCGTGVFLNAARNFLWRWYFERLGRELTSCERERVARTQLFGVELDSRAVRIARQLVTPNVRCANLLTGFDWDGRFSDAFDVVIGNPPYGAPANTAALVMRLARIHTRGGGYNGFIVPKSFLYATNWKAIRGELREEITLVADLGKAWSEVKLEQMIYASRKETRNGHYDSYVREGSRLLHIGRIKKTQCDSFGFLLNGVTPEEVALGLKIQRVGAFLGEFVRNVRGAPLQAKLLSSGKFRAVGGKQVQPFQIIGEKGYVDEAVPDNARIERGNILVQNIVAHVRFPKDHLKITAAVAGPLEEQTCVVLDTVNRLENRSSVPSEDLAALLQSRLINWYVYRFIVGRAVRTIHFDGPVTNRIPVPPGFRLEGKDVQRAIYAHYGLSSREITLLHESE